MSAAAAPAPGPASESVAVVIGPDAPQLERFAAGELCGYLDKLFGVKVTPVTRIPASTDHVFLIGSPATNPLIRADEFPDASDQGIVLKTVKRDGSDGSALIVGGGSP